MQRFFSKENYFVIQINKNDVSQQNRNVYFKDNMYIMLKYSRASIIR